MGLRVLASLLVVAVVTATAGSGVSSASVSLASFEDVVGVHQAAVDALATMGVFDGTECGQDLFCPDEPISRWTMAVWLVRILDEPEPSADSSRFVDVDAAEWWMPYAERLAELEITRGCATEPRRFCPEDPVSRAHMASFLSRAFELEAPEERPEVEFADVEEGSHTDNIHALAASGITRGCATEPLRFCPRQPTTRAQMASFLVRTLAVFGTDAGVSLASFEDVVGVHQAAVDALATMGVFDGTECGQDLFCPDEPISRWTMAVWLVRILDEPEPSADSSRFVDVDAAEWWMPYAERLAELEITRGCATEPRRFCPEDPVSRAHMASFLSRAFELEAPEERPEVEFADVEEGSHTDNIHALAASGITRGCATEPLRFCPRQPTTRAQMASFLKRAYTRFIGPCPSEAEPDPEHESAESGDETVLGGDSGGGTGTGGGASGGGASGGDGGNNPEPTSSTQRPSQVPGPSSLAVMAGDQSLAVTWDPLPAPLDVIGYRVRWKGPGQEYSDTDRWAIAVGTRYGIGDLTNGRTYVVQVAAAVRDYGFGEWSTVSGVPRTVPGAPQAVGVARGDGRLTVTWQAPADDGGAPVTGYRLEREADGRPTAVEDAAGTSHGLENLTNGVEYRVRVAAANEAGPGAWSAQSAGTPAGPPHAPVGVSAQPGDRSVTVTWAIPGDGGSAINAYKVQWRAGDAAFEDTDPRSTVSGQDLSARIGSLTNGTRYFVRVLAENDAGEGPWSATASAAAADVSGPPRSVTAERGDRSATVTWQQPSHDGGSAIAAYKVQWRTPTTRYHPARQATVTDLTHLTHTIRGLTNGRWYFVRVLAVNDVGDGEVSAEASFRPATVPGPPRNLTLEVQDRALGVSWTVPHDGASAITAHRVQWRAGDAAFEDTDSQVPVSGQDLSARIGSLTNKTPYFVRVLAENDVGEGPWSATASATPSAPAGEPQGVTTQSGDGSITVTWQEPADAGDTAITSYTLQWRTGDEDYGSTRQATVTDLTDLTHTIGGLDNGTEYWIRLWAVNAAGAGAPAATSAVPRTVPDAPGAPVIHSSTGTLTLSWDPPESDGGSSITGYRVQWKGPGEEYNTTDRQATVTSPRHEVTGLTDGATYTVSIVAVNELGPGPAVEASKVVTVPPGPPLSTVSEGHNSSLRVSWAAPDTTGGSAITEYRLLWKGPDEDFDDSSCSFRRITIGADRDLAAAIGGLVNGTAYGLRLVAVNDAGPGAAADFSGTPVAIPGPPRSVAPFAVDGGLHVLWDAPWDGGSPITGYRVQWKGPGEEYNDTDREADVGASGRSHEITDLTNGTRYGVRVLAVNANGHSRVPAGCLSRPRPDECRDFTAEANGTPGDAPGRPGSAAVTAEAALHPFYPGSRQCRVVVAWDVPADRGGSAITSYTVWWRRPWDTAYARENIRVSIGFSRSHTISWFVSILDVCAGPTYRFRVSAANSDGVGPAAEVSGGF